MGDCLEGRNEENQTSHISLEVLFCNASIKHIENQQTNSHTMQQTKAIQSCVVDEAETVASKVPSILKRLGSSVPMVEDLEREHQNEHQSSGTNVLPSSSSMTANFPLSKTTKFMTQLSSSENQSSSDLLQSFHYNYLGQTSTIVSNLPTVCDILNPNSVLNNIDPFCTGTVSQSSHQNVASLQSCSTSLSNYQQNNVERKKISSMHNLPTNFFLPVSTGNCTNSSDFTTSLLSTNSKGDNSATFSHTRLSSPILGKNKSQNLLTPADIETIPSSIISAMGMSGCSGVGPETLLSPMAFVSQTRTTSSSNNSSDMAKIKNESNVTPLTKEQLQEALLYIIKNDSSLVSRIHEAYFLKLNTEISNPIM